MAGYHFYQRVLFHKEFLKENRDELKQSISRAVKGVARVKKIHIHPTHFHLFAEVKEKEKLLLVSRIKNEIQKLDIPWAAEYSLTPASLSQKEMSRLLREWHRVPLI